MRTQSNLHRIKRAPLLINRSREVFLRVSDAFFLEIFEGMQLVNNVSLMNRTAPRLLDSSVWTVNKLHEIL